MKQCLDDAEKLRKAGFNGSALIAGVTAIELIIRFLLLRPLVSGAFLSEEWESILTERIGEGPHCPEIWFHLGEDWNVVAYTTRT